MSIETLQDVEVFIDTLVATGMLWHAEDLVASIPNFNNLQNKEMLQDLMNSAYEVCEEHDCSIFDFYPEQ